MGVRTRLLGKLEILRPMPRLLPAELQRMAVALAESGKAIIQRRTAAGRDVVHLAPWAPYTPRYAAFRKRHGKHVGTPRLNFDDVMMRTLVAIAGSKPGQIFLGWTDQKQVDKARGNERKRKFFGIQHPSELRLLDARAKHEASKIMGGGT